MGLDLDLDLSLVLRLIMYVHALCACASAWACACVFVCGIARCALCTVNLMHVFHVYISKKTFYNIFNARPPAHPPRVAGNDLLFFYFICVY